MRGIKFRVWNKKQNRYNTQTDAPVLVYDTGELAVRYGNPACGAVELDYTDNYEIEQYTGLKDKNGKEIYEGDIIQEEIDFNSKMTDGIFKYMVYWNEEDLCWGLEHIGNESIHVELWQANLSTEVIGNIHENPELIKEKV